ncbi:hypothetical protein Halhy_4652 [Haliscomenobacter hydrossis DSM 1100]|uniref:Uncharacterized protein n=1 Tax=Haliscomenobacter hydrossis (strain ATCC 27775 / DSM 1100 / LMG 10767 / O) TaxID=760192 RepID=F4KVN1_HALH1|nr:hypothetical protein Halhy_4652 [Haliscomenobacter hydrossis DSM 1100]
MTRIKRIFADLIRVNPLNPRHPRSHLACREKAEGSERSEKFVYMRLSAIDRAKNH